MVFATPGPTDSGRGLVFSLAPELPAPAQASDALSQADLEQLLGPIALYPDKLLANVLAASIYPDEIAKAATYLSKGGQLATLSSQGLEPAVQDVAAIPEVLNMLSGSPQWTAALGQAYITQGPAVMQAIQSLRQKANLNGALVSNPQMTVVQQGSTIIIEQPSPEIVYVPTYNPQVVYVDNGPSRSDVVAASVISFGLGVAVGAIWQNNVDCDWHSNSICWGSWGRGGYRNNYYRGDTNVNVNINNNYNRVRVGGDSDRWRPNDNKVRPNTTNGRYNTRDLDQFKGASNRDNNVNRPNIPNTPRNPSPNRPAQRPATPRPAKPSTPAARPQNAPRPNNLPASGFRPNSGDAGASRGNVSRQAAGQRSPAPNRAPANRGSGAGRGR